MFLKRLLFVAVLLALSLSACGGVGTEVQTVRVAVLPVLDVLPMYVAQEQGYFEANGVLVEFVPVGAAPERDQLMQAGQVDAILNELVSTMFYNQDETQVKIVRFARVATTEYPVFRILASADSGIETVDDLAGVPVGISEGTVIAYTTERILEKAGLTPDEIAEVAVPKIPDRLNLLQTGDLQAANLPDPVASLAVLNGAHVVIDDTSYPEISNSVITFSADFIEAHPEAVRGFLAAYEQAVADINADKSAWTAMMLEESLLPPPLADTYVLPDYPIASVPSEAQFADALEWVQSKDLIEGVPTYADSVTAEFLP
ncbi:MAG: ABC transporter substrate-binding protein [Anaerolineales bacterium]|nr:ABC transporter substrate-binding protein [Anaerolineales bacterium]